MPRFGWKSLMLGKQRTPAEDYTKWLQTTILAPKGNSNSRKLKKILRSKKLQISLSIQMERRPLQVGKHPSRNYNIWWGELIKLLTCAPSRFLVRTGPACLRAWWASIGKRGTFHRLFTASHFIDQMRIRMSKHLFSPFVGCPTYSTSTHYRDRTLRAFWNKSFEKTIYVLA